jgi:hypothetical protein
MAEMTTDQWRADLNIGLDYRLPKIALYDRYYDGDHRMQFATTKFQEAFGEMFGAFATNWCGLVVDVACERLKVQGFRFGEPDADDEAWAIWQANSMDAQSLQLHTEAVKAGVAYAMVSPPEEDGGEPVITVEHPAQVICAHDPADRRKVIAALKRFTDSNGDHVQQVYEPSAITTYRRRDEAERANRLSILGIFVDMRGAEDWDSRVVEDNPLGRVPVVPFENNPDLLTGGRSDLRPAVGLNDAANKFFMDMIHASEFISFPQRVLTGVQLPKDPITGEVVEATVLRSAVSRLWAFEDPNARVFDLAIGSLANYVEGVDLAVQHMAAQTRTPPHYLLAKLANLAADALKAAETGLNMRCQRKQLDFADSWEEVIRLSFAWRAFVRKGWAGADEDQWRAQYTNAETLWMDPESKDPINETQALTNLKTIGVPDETLWEQAGYSPQQIKRMRKQRDEQDKRQMALAQAGVAGGQQGPSGATGGPNLTLQPGEKEFAVSGLPAPPPQPGQNGGGQPKGQPSGQPPSQ